MNCKQAEELLPLYVRRDLEEKSATLVTEHVQACSACARVAEEYREFVQLTEQFTPPVFSEAVFAGIRQRVLREIETEAMPPAWSQTIVSLFRPRLTWAIASMLLITVSLFAIYLIVIRGNDEQRLAGNPPVKVQPRNKEHSNSGSQGDKRAVLPPSVSTGGKQQTGPPQLQAKRSRNPLGDRRNTVSAKSSDAMTTAKSVSPQPSNLPEPALFPPRNSAALGKTLRVEIQTKDPNIRIIWFAQQETKTIIPSSKGT